MIILKKAFHLAFGAHIPTHIWAISITFFYHQNKQWNDSIPKTFW
jgi:hypothetical protein